MKIFYVLFTSKLWGEYNDTRLVLISSRRVMGEETVPKQGHLIYSEPHMTFSTNWCEILCNVTNSWLPLTHYLSFSLSPSASSLSIYHLFAFSPPLFLHSFSHRRWHSSSHRRLKRGWRFFIYIYIYDTAQPNYFWMNSALCHSQGDRKCIPCFSLISKC